MKKQWTTVVLGALLVTGMAQGGEFFAAAQITYADVTGDPQGVALPAGSLAAIQKAGRFDFEFVIDVAPGTGDLSGARVMMFSTGNASDDGFGINVNYSSGDALFSFVFPRVETTSGGGTGGDNETGYFQGIAAGTRITGYVLFNQAFTEAQTTITIGGVSASTQFVPFPVGGVDADPIGETVAIRRDGFIIRDMKLSVDGEIVPPASDPSFAEGLTENPNTFGSLSNSAGWSLTINRMNFGWFYQADYPWIWKLDDGWIYVVFSGPEALYFYKWTEGAWYYTTLEWYPGAWNLSTGLWRDSIPQS